MSVASMLAREVFSTADRTYRWVDVVLAAQLWGDWEVLRGQVREGVACVKRFQEAEDVVAPDEVDSAAKEFRYARDLITGEELESWLETRGLTAGTWLGYIQRSMLRGKCSGELPDIVSRHPVTDDEVESLMECEGICSGRFGQLSQRLATRAAAYDRLIERAGVDAIESLAASGSVAGPHPFAVGLETCGLPGVSRQVCEQKAEFLAKLELAFREFCMRAPSAEAVGRQISAHSLDWIRFDCRLLAFPDEDVAREAALCVRADGKPLAEIAAETGTIERETRFLLDDMEPELREFFLAARKGDLLGPFKREGNYELFLVAEKVIPTIGDSGIRERAERHVVETAVTREIASRIRWRDRW